MKRILHYISYLIPYDNIIYKTDLSPEEIYSRLDDNIQPFGLYDRIQDMCSDSTIERKLYQGTLDKYKFRIYEITEERNSFLPEIKGEILYENLVCSVHIKMRLHPVVKFLLGVITLFVFWKTVNNIVDLARGVEGVSFILSYIWFAGYCVLLMFFKAETIHHKKFFGKLFQVDSYINKLSGRNVEIDFLS